jgi:hypothetical protein
MLGARNDMPATQPSGKKGSWRATKTSIHQITSAPFPPRIRRRSLAAAADHRNRHTQPFDVYRSPIRFKNEVKPARRLLWLG